MDFNQTGRLYVSDLDGTLLNSKGKLSPRTKSVIRNFIEAGGAFTICTGRPTGTALAIAEELELELPVLTYNGAMAYSLNERSYVHHSLLPEGVTDRLVELCHEHGVECLLYALEAGGSTVLVHDGFTQPIMQRFLVDHLEFEHLTDRKAAQLKLSESDRAVQLIAIHKKSVLDRLKQAILEEFELKIFLVECFRDPGEWFFEVTSMNSTKGKGINWLRGHIGAREVICFGDLSNDIPMFERSDFAVAMENANDQLKALSNAITLSNDSHGVAHFIGERYGL